MTLFPYDDPVWDEAPHCYGLGANALLAEIEKDWCDDAAEYLFFSALLHQGTMYPASYLAIPHLLRLAENLTGKPRLMIANLMGGFALAGQQPGHVSCSGVSCSPDSAWWETQVGKAAVEEFEKSLPKIGALSVEAYKAYPSHFFASGLAAAEGEIEFAGWLTIGENGGFQCPKCCGHHDWWLLDKKMGIYRNDDVFCGSPNWLDDYDKKVFEHADSIAIPQTEPSRISAFRAQLGSLDPITNCLFTNFKSMVICAYCDWVGPHP